MQSSVGSGHLSSDIMPIHKARSLVHLQLIRLSATRLFSGTYTLSILVITDIPYRFIFSPSGD